MARYPWESTGERISALNRVQLLETQDHYIPVTLGGTPLHTKSVFSSAQLFHAVQNGLDESQLNPTLYNNLLNCFT